MHRTLLRNVHTGMRFNLGSRFPCRASDCDPEQADCSDSHMDA